MKTDRILTGHEKMLVEILFNFEAGVKLGLFKKVNGKYVLTEKGDKFADVLIEKIRARG